VRSTAVKGVKPVMNFVTRTRVLVLLVLGLGAGLLVAALGNAGTNTTLFQAVEGPGSLHQGQQGLVFAKFEPSTSSGSATHTVITFTFPTTGAVTNPTPDPTTSSDCAPVAGQPLTIACAVGTVNPGQLVKRFVTFTGGPAGQSANITVSVSFDAGSSGAKGGGQVNPPNPITLPVSIVDGSTADGTCQSGGASVLTLAITNKNGVTQQTQLDFGNSATQFPCTWGSVGVQPFVGQAPGGGAPQISSVDGPTFGQPAALTLTFSKLPAHFVLEESLVDPSVAKPSDWKPVPFCPAPTADTCIVSYENGNPIVAHLLFRGLGVDPWFN
jgi:hypothetical protein